MTGKKMQETEGKLCFVENMFRNKSIPEKYKRLLKEPKYMCKECGRVAANDNNLCYPEGL
jgi:hypothetical protein